MWLACSCDARLFAYKCSEELTIQPCLLCSNSTLFIIWWNKLTQPFCKHLDCKKKKPKKPTRLKSEMPGEVTDWSSPLFVHPRWTETVVELNRYRSAAERPWVGTCIIIRAVSQWHCSHWKCLTGLSHWSECCWEETVKYLILKKPVFKHFSGWV